MIKTSVLRFTAGQTRRILLSSPAVWRSFSPHCGSPITYRSDRRPEIIDLYVGTLDDPTVVMPGCHVHTSDQIALPCFAGSRRGTTPGGSSRSGSEAPRRRRCKRAIDPHFREGNATFAKNPRRPGNVIWGEERAPPFFNQVQL
jgi:hypothetical protein